eukprot:scaffold2946_cov294-Pinguiococcus_pyrenoidosus.AAC.5
MQRSISSVLARRSGGVAETETRTLSATRVRTSKVSTSMLRKTLSPTRAAAAPKALLASLIVSPLKSSSSSRSV